MTSFFMCSSSRGEFLFRTLSSIVRAGLNTLLLSPRSNVSAIVDLCQQCDCHILVTRNGCMGELPENIQVFKVSPIDLNHLTCDAIHMESSMPKCESSELMEVRFCLHTSGSTGTPKAIFCTNRYVLANSTIGISIGLNGFSSSERRLAFGPLFHTMGLITVWAACIVAGVEVILPAVKAWPPSSEDILRALTLNEPTSVTFVPSLLQQICGYIPRGDARWEILRRIRSITYGGAHSTLR